MLKRPQINITTENSINITNYLHVQELESKISSDFQIGHWKLSASGCSATDAVIRAGYIIQGIRPQQRNSLRLSPINEDNASVTGSSSCCGHALFSISTCFYKRIDSKSPGRHQRSQSGHAREVSTPEEDTIDLSRKTTLNTFPYTDLIKSTTKIIICSFTKTLLQYISSEESRKSMITMEQFMIY